MPAQKRVRRTLTTEPVVAKASLTVNDVKKIVRKELSDELEEKHAITQYENVPLNAAIPSGVVVNGAGNFFKLMPEVTQSTTGSTGTAYNERIGNEINLKELDIRGYLSYAGAIANTVNESKLAVRVMILRAIDVNDQDLLFDNMPTGSLLRFGNQTGGTGGPTGFTGFPLDSVRDINTDQFQVNYDKVHYLNAPLVTVGTSAVTYSTGYPSGLKMIEHKIRFGSKGLKLKYGSRFDREPQNFPYFMVIGYTSMGDGAVPPDNQCRATFSVVSSFTDA